LFLSIICGNIILQILSRFIDCPELRQKMTPLKFSTHLGEANTALIPIGAVAKATGINASTLRIWEHRYGVPKPHRTDGGARRYAPTEVQRLKLIKALVDIGHKPSNLSSMSLDELAEHLNFLNPHLPHQRKSAEQIRLLTVGDTTGLKSLLRDESLSDLEIVTHLSDPVEIVHWLGKFDVLLFNYSALQSTQAQQLIHLTQRLSSSMGTMVIYNYSNSTTIQTLETAGIPCLKTPLNSTDVRELLDIFYEKARLNINTPRKTEKKFSSEDLETISALDYSLYCECPRHLAGLLMSLNGFVSYSEQCLDVSPKDAAIHRFLRTMAADAIASIESGLELVLTAEDITLPDIAAQNK
jgi:DNA-binding transcriptional MerR regulator